MKKIGLLFITLLITLITWSGEGYSDNSEYNLESVMLNSDFNSDMSMSGYMKSSYNGSDGKELYVMYYIIGAAAIVNGVYFIGHSLDKTPPTVYNPDTKKYESNLHSVPWGINITAGIGCAAILTYHFSLRF